jgi:hypothetical protein
MTNTGNTITYYFMNYLVIPAVSIALLVALTSNLTQWYDKIGYASIIYIISFCASSIVLKYTGKPAFKDGTDAKQKLLSLLIKILSFSLSASLLLTYAFTDGKMSVDEVGFSITWKFLATYMIVWIIIAAIPKIVIRKK